MAQVTNISAFKALCIPQAFYHGRIYDCLLLKATFKIGHDGALLPLANPPDFVLNDATEPESVDAVARRQLIAKRRKPDADPYDVEDYAAIVYPSEIVAYKPATDVIVVGHARPAGQVPTARWLVNVCVEGRDKTVHIDKTVKVLGPRAWTHTMMGGWTLSEPTEVSQVALTFANAYGGIVQDGLYKKDVFWANPGGVGFFGRVGADPFQSHPAPQIERPDQIVGSVETPVDSVGLSAVSARQFERLQFVGTYDKAWRESVAPNVPIDFDSAFWNMAPRDQVVSPYLEGGETIRTVGLFATPDGALDFVLPQMIAQVVCLRDGALGRSQMMDLDTVIIDADRRHVTLRWQTIVEQADGFDEYEVIGLVKPYANGQGA